MLNWILPCFLAAVNIAAYFLMYIDKQKAVKQQWRIAEKTLFLLCLCGGFIGIHLGMKHFRHKTQHLSFKIIVSVSAILWLAVLPFSVFYLTK
ncbi:DUF1294 domain-containing protein [Caviibacterium pharyngocola]|uniref:DUF1294 domain-containing protein n=1 Tax=Caviibacterium pharyngocola TaxID=28159 RepID=A0A2M8RSZ7_9PAST|nr:DUF1294 domain-containing protein [Caviibacterium pharyngocola]PJG82014.1 DUF1294 domain-containing protein [Caviibacterium pharyngocola]